MNKADFARRLAWLIAWLSLAVAALGFGANVLVWVWGDGERWLRPHMWFSPALSLPAVLAGALIIKKHPRHAIGWLCTTIGFFSALNALAFGYQLLSEASIIMLPGLAFVRWLNLWIWIPASALPVTFVLLLFPDGRMPSARWWPIGWAAGLGTIAFTFAVALHPNPPLEPTPTPNPLGVANAEAALNLLLNVAGVFFAVGLVGSWAALVRRFQRARGVEREQVKWLAYATILSLLIVFPISIWQAAAPDNLVVFEISLISFFVMLAAIATAVGVAIVRHRLYDIDLVINRTLVYGALTAGVMAVYLLVVVGLGMVFQTSGNLVLSLFGVGTVTLVVQPMRERLQRAVNRWLYGERDDAYTVLSRLGQRLESTLAPEAILPNIVETIQEALKLPVVKIEVDRESLPTDLLTDKVSLFTFPLLYQSELVGHLIVSPRVGETTLSAADRRLLEDVARQAGVAVYAARLTADLQHSRERLVTAREEERRRLRRDLHDGLGSQFAALHLRADTLRTLIQNNPQAAEAMAVELRDEIRAAVADIRRLVYELRPPALDELGLAGAMRALASQRTSANGLQVLIDAPEPLPPLPAAVEVAAYRIAQEALTNVVRHAQAHTCHIRLALADDLRLEIKDDGVGLPPQTQIGVGLRSMRERAAELGGTCVAETARDGGAWVLASLPLAQRSAASPNHSITQSANG